MTILVTGGAGYIGGHVMHGILDRKARLAHALAWERKAKAQ
jgi:nucleoside-diphosphate-sugar epimerase